MCIVPSQLRPLSSLSSLRQLHMSCNQISSLAALSRLTALTSLSCEGNAVASLVQLSSFSSLVELYAAHNAVSDIKVSAHTAPFLNALWHSERVLFYAAARALSKDLNQLDRLLRPMQTSTTCSKDQYISVTPCALYLCVSATGG
jgi:Leucine-rich repeat (LRR) protein